MEYTSAFQEYRAFILLTFKQISNTVWILECT